MGLERKINLTRSIVLAVFIGLCGCSSTEKFTQIPTAVPTGVQNRLEFLNSTYKLEPPDALAIRVLDNPDLDSQMIIRPDGNITYPLLGDVYVAGHTPLEVREKLWKLLGTYIRELPLEAIEVQVVGFNSKKIFVFNERIGMRELPYTGGTTVLSAIAQSGLLNSTAAMGDIKVVRTTNHERQEPQKLVVDLNDILKEGKGERNIVLQENDIVYIPSKLLAKIGSVFQDMLVPMYGMQRVGYFAESAMFNALGFAGPTQGWQGWMGQKGTGTTANIRTNTPFFNLGNIPNISGVTP
ncbi:MAG: polysaccharide biosynthesis/export family protein [Candidatus Brocadiales bacterium]